MLNQPLHTGLSMDVCNHYNYQPGTVCARAVFYCDATIRFLKEEDMDKIHMPDPIRSIELELITASCRFLLSPVFALISNENQPVFDNNSIDCLGRPPKTLTKP